MISYIIMFIATVLITWLMRMNTIKQINDSSNKQYLPLLSLTLTVIFDYYPLLCPK